jgi:hypothetical protein
MGVEAAQELVDLVQKDISFAFLVHDEAGQPILHQLLRQCSMLGGAEVVV